MLELGLADDLAEVPGEERGGLPRCRSDRGHHAAYSSRISVFQFQRILRDIIEGLDPPELGLKHSKLAVTAFLDGDTGRVALPEKNFDPVVVTSPNVPFRPRDDLARAILIRIRKRDFLDRPDTPVVVKRDPRLHGTPKHQPDAE